MYHPELKQQNRLKDIKNTKVNLDIYEIHENFSRNAINLYWVFHTNLCKHKYTCLYAHIY